MLILCGFARPLHQARHFLEADDMPTPEERSQNQDRALHVFRLGAVLRKNLGGYGAPSHPHGPALQTVFRGEMRVRGVVIGLAGMDL